MTTSERYFSQKIKTLFARFDMDRNGLIELEDFVRWSKKLTQIGKLNKERSNALTESLFSVWEALFIPADTNNDGSIEIPELVIHLRDAMKDPVKSKTIQDALPLIFDSVDSNLDSSISCDEFNYYFSSFGINDPKFSSDVFNLIDRNHNGELSKTEFCKFGLDFFLGNNPASPSRFFFGPPAK